MQYANHLLFKMGSFVLVLGLTSGVSLSHEHSSVELPGLNETLNEYSKNPDAFYFKTPEKRNQQGVVVSGGIPTDLASGWSENFLEQKMQVQSLLWSKSETLNSTVAPRRGHLRPQAEINFSTDNPENVADVIRFRTLSEMDGWSGSLRAAQLPVQPWSDTYWPTYLGGSSYRYADPNFPDSEDWNVNASYIKNSMGQSSHLAYLSPAEKYDLLVGDTDFTLTKAVLAVGESLQNQFGSVASWQGICHGWSAAAIMFDRPTKGINMLSTTGKSIPFYPADIKALATLLWANNNYSARITGLRCNVTDANGASDRSAHPECWDNNPATFHLALINQIGVSKRSMVFDATWDSEVWNQPILGYSYTYFNPQTQYQSSSIESASISPEEFTQDRYKSTRSSRAAKIVGIAMDLTYMVETQPILSLSDGPANDRAKKVRYLYDLELDSTGKIIGGEWYQNAHPDFMWVPAKGARAVSQGDSMVSSQGITAAARAASRGAQPLAIIVEQLVRMSSTGR